MGALSVYNIKNLLKPQRNIINPSDDFRVLDSWVEYDDSKPNIEERPLKYMCYEIEVVNPETGERSHAYKAIKFARIIRIPKNAKQSTSLMDKHQQILTAVYEKEINLITIIANVINPVPIGLLFMYGVQGVSTDIEDAKEKADLDFAGLISSLQGTYRVLEVSIAKAQEIEWLKDKMFGMEYVTAIRGIPKANKAGEDAGNKTMSGTSINPESQGTLEEIIAGMADYEYVIQTISTPVPMYVLKQYQNRTESFMTDWYSQLQGQKNISFSVSLPMVYAANAGTSAGTSHAYTNSESVNYSTSENFSTSLGTSTGESLSESFGETIGHTSGTSFSESSSQSSSVSQSTSIGESVTLGESSNQGISTGTSIGSSLTTSQGTNTSTGMSENSSISSNKSDSIGTSNSLSENSSFSSSMGETEGTSQNIGHSNSVSTGSSQSATTGTSSSLSSGQTVTNSNSASHSSGTTEGVSVGESQSNSWNNGKNTSTNFGMNNNTSDTAGSSKGNTDGNAFSFGAFGTSGNTSNAETNTLSSSITNSEGFNTSYGNGLSYSEGGGESSSVTGSTSVSNNDSYSQSSSLGSSKSESVGTSNSLSESITQNSSQGTTESFGNSASSSLSESYGTSIGTSSGQSTSSSVSNGYSQSTGLTQSAGTSQGLSQGTTQGSSESHTIGSGSSISKGESVTQGTSTSQSTSIGQTVGSSESDSYSQNKGTSTSQSTTQSQSNTSGTGYSTSNGTSTSTSNSVNNSVSSGISSSLGLGPSIGYSKSYQWLDQQVKDIIELLEFDNNRYKRGLRGEGAFYTYMYMACPSMEALASAQMVAKSAWQNEYALTHPLQVLDLNEDEQKHLLYHFSAFSSDVSKEDVFGIQDYRYCTVLLPSEYVAYTHLPRISEGGIYADVNDIPKFAVPGYMKGEIYMGTVLSAERFTLKNGYHTEFDYRLDEAELMHGFFTGSSRSGKTVAAMRFVRELSKVRRKATGKKMRIVCLDPKRDWRGLARYIEPERFKFYSLGNVNFRPIKLNPWKIPKGVWPQIWIDGVIDIYCRAYGLLERGKQMMGEIIYALYDEAGVFAACDKENWKETVSEKSKNVTFEAIYNRMERKRQELSDGKVKVGFDTMDAYARLLDRLQAFNRSYSIEHQLFGTSEGIGIDELIGNDDVTVLESKGLENTFRNFIFGVITSGFYKFALAQENGFLSDDQYETVLVVEEANEILTGNDAAGTGGGQQMGMSGQSEFEQILDQSAGYGLYIMAITQSISKMPASIIANAGLKFIGKISRVEDVNVAIRSIGREERYEDRDIVKWLAKSPTGWFIIHSSRGTDFKKAEPVLVHIANLNMSAPTNAEINDIMTRKEAIEKIKE